MTCDPLPGTGLDANVWPLLLLGMGLLVAGALTVLLGRRRGHGTSVVLVGALLLGGAGSLVGLGAPAPAHAATPGCSSAQPTSQPTAQPSEQPASSQPSSRPLPQSVSPQHYLEVTQTSTMHGLAPHVAPVPITGRLVNHSPERTYVAAVHVEITGVTVAADAVAGPCSASDYRLLDPGMAVGRTLEPGGTMPFAGASIGFNDLGHNQDACQGATIQLRYTANPG